LADLSHIPASVWVFDGLLVCLALYVYGRVVQRLAREGGQVRAAGFDLPELLMTFVIGGFFVWLIVKTALRQGEEPMKMEKVLPGSLLFVVISVGILWFLKYVRRLRLREIFGLAKLAPHTVLGWAIGLLLAIYPILGVASMITKLVMKENYSNQALVNLFTEVARQDDHAGVAMIFVVGTVLAPCCEEFLFRGFFYGVWKRYLGPLGAGLIASALFAAMHASVPAFASLFVLAVGLNLAYERTGSLFVPICLHACFNGVSLGYLYLQARFPDLLNPT